MYSSRCHDKFSSFPAGPFTDDCLEFSSFDLKVVLKSTQGMLVIRCIDECLELVFVHDVNISITISLHYHISIIQPHCNSAIIAIISYQSRILLACDRCSAAWLNNSFSEPVDSACSVVFLIHCLTSVFWACGYEYSQVCTGRRNDSICSTCGISHQMQGMNPNQSTKLTFSRWLILTFLLLQVAEFDRVHLPTPPPPPGLPALACVFAVQHNNG